MKSFKSKRGKKNVDDDLNKNNNYIDDNIHRFNNDTSMIIIKTDDDIVNDNNNLLPPKRKESISDWVNATTDFHNINVANVNDERGKEERNDSNEMEKERNGEYHLHNIHNIHNLLQGRNGNGKDRRRVEDGDNHNNFDNQSNLTGFESLPSMMDTAINILTLYYQVQNIDDRLKNLEAYIYNNPIIVPNSININNSPNYDDPIASFGNTNDLSKKTLTFRGHIKRNDLDRVCLSVLENNPFPSMQDQNDLARQLEDIYSNIDRKEILSSIRKWFRKRREEMSQRVFVLCKKIYSEENLSDRNRVNEIINDLANNEKLQNDIRLDADLGIIDETMSKRFCFTKVCSYLRRHNLD